MATLYTVDASVFLNAFYPSEVGHEDSYVFLERLRGRATPIVVPNLLLPEVAAAIARRGGDRQVAQAYVANLVRLRHIQLIPLDPVLAPRAAELAATHRVRGSDAVYGAVALRYGSDLVTRDREQHERLAPVITTRFPIEALQDDEV